MLPLDASRPGAAGDDREAAARGLEAYFVRQMLAELTKGTDGLFGGGASGATFKDMFNEAIAESVAAAGGLGLTAQLGPALEAGGAATSPALSELLSARGPGSGAPPGHLPGGLAGPLPAIGPSRALGAYQRGVALPARPVDGVVSSAFGVRTDPIDGERHHHHGIDVAAPAGAPVRAAGAGRVVKAGEEGGYGNVVIIDHGRGLETRYAHLGTIDVKPGDRVEAGAGVGTVGVTGRTTGPHLHFEVRRDGEPVDPRLLSPLGRR